MALYLIPAFLVFVIILMFIVLVSPPTRWLERWDKKRPPVDQIDALNPEGEATPPLDAKSLTEQEPDKKV